MGQGRGRGTPIFAGRNLSTPREIRARRIDVEIHLIDAALRLGVAGTGTPGAISEARVLDLGEIEALPFTFGVQAFAALAADLEGQHPFCAFSVAKDRRAEHALE